MYFLETLQVCAPCHGGVLYSFWYWWNVWIFYEFFKYWKKLNLNFCFFQYFMFSSRFVLFPTLKKNWCKKKKIRGGGVEFFFCRKTIISHFMFYAIFNIKKIYLTVPLHLLVKWEVVSPNSREGQLESISIYILYSLVLILYLKCGGGGGGCNVF